MPVDLSDAVRRAKQGDEEAFRFLYRSVQPGLLRYLTALVGADAEDVASETWLQISRDLRSFEGGPAFRAWAATIARNRALDHLRHHNRRPAQPVPATTLVGLPGNDDTAERAGEQIATDAAIALIATLPPTEAEAVLLRTVVGLDAKAAGRVLGKRAGAVRIAAHRGLRRLARMLEQGDPPAPAAWSGQPDRTRRTARSEQTGRREQAKLAGPAERNTGIEGSTQAGRAEPPERTAQQQVRRTERGGNGPVRAGLVSRLAAATPVNAPGAAWINKTSTRGGWDGRGWE